MRSLNGIVFGLVAMSLGVAGVASAEDLYSPAARQGYYVGGGFRSGLLSASAEGLGGLGLMQGGAFTLRFGQMAGETFGLGLLISSGGGANDEWSGGYGALSLDVQYQPIRTENLALRGSIGIAGLGLGRRDEAQKRETDPSGGLGVLYNLGVSYELFPFWDAPESGGFAFSGFLDLQLATGDGISTGGVLIGLEFTYWFGFARNKLDLPADAAFAN